MGVGVRFTQGLEMSVEIVGSRVGTSDPPFFSSSLDLRYYRVNCKVDLSSIASPSFYHQDRSIIQ